METGGEIRPSAKATQEMRARLDWPVDALLRECDLHIHRTGGPGGQHRNKVATAIRLVHRPSGLVVTAGETRSQQENKAVAVQRLREALAVAVRATPPDGPVRWPESVKIQAGRLRVNPSNAAYAHVLGVTLDVLASHGGKLAESAAQLGVTSSSLSRFLADCPRAWVELGRIRREAGLPPLRAS